jgi:hypothetical protein
MDKRFLYRKKKNIIGIVLIIIDLAYAHDASRGRGIVTSLKILVIMAKH